MKALLHIILILSPLLASAQSDFIHESSIVNSKGERIYPNSENKQAVCPYSLEKFFRKNIKYPAEGIKDKIEGKVFVQFTIDSTGKVINPVILRGLGYGFDEEVVRVVQLLPDWEPSYVDGKPVSSLRVMPINFSQPKKKLNDI